jgi:cytochrome c-type biogenesis protein CcmH
MRHCEACPEAYAGLGEAGVLAAGGVVPAAAREGMAEALRLDPKHPLARFFIAIGLKQDGDAHGAIGAFRASLGDAGADTPSTKAVSNCLLVSRPMPPAEQQATIRAMVDGLELGCRKADLLRVS